MRFVAPQGVVLWIWKGGGCLALIGANPPLLKRPPNPSQAMLAVLLPLHEKMERQGPTTLKEIAFVQVGREC